MKAAVYERYGPPDVLEIREVPTPIPRDSEIRIKVHATTVTSGDWRLRSLDVPVGFRLLSRLMFGIRRPRKTILGMELAGRIESVGKKVRRFKAGDDVFAFSEADMGAYAEYTCLREDAAVALKPPNLTDGESAALSFGGTTALYFLKKGKVKGGEKVLINGASGGVGTAMVQLARHFGAEVTGVCSTANLALVKSLGAHRVIDYTREDFTKSGDTYDVIVDTAGTARFSRSRNSLKQGGRLLLVLGGLPSLLQIPWVAMTGNRRIIAGAASGSGKDLQFLAGLAEAGQFKPVIDRCYPFEQITEAHRYVDTGRKKGNVVVTLGQGTK
jgi:NADPH:quinone reductase-like Zn-dependent oxidoreductase